MNIWIYRPDRESQERKINKNFVYDCHDIPYWVIFDAKNEVKKLKNELQEKKHREVCNISIEVSHD